MEKTIKTKGSSKGALLKHYDEHVERKELHESDIPNVSGVYALYGYDGLCYIGIAKNLKRRLNQHYRGKKKKWNNFSWYVIPELKFVRDIETVIVRIVHPKYNKQIGRIPKIGKTIKTILILGFILLSNVTFCQKKTTKTIPKISSTVVTDFGYACSYNDYIQAFSLRCIHNGEPELSMSDCIMKLRTIPFDERTLSLICQGMRNYFSNSKSTLAVVLTDLGMDENEANTMANYIYDNYQVK